MAYLRGIFYSLPVQLLFLHFRKYQVLLIFWIFLFACISGNFMKTFGADALFLAPEYLGNVNGLSMALIGVSLGVFIMCWNITTFILFSRHFSFLAATQFPFLKYCINNSIIPLLFLLYYIIKAAAFAHYKELIPKVEIVFLMLGFFAGLLLVLAISFFYFFRADKTILRSLQPLFKTATSYISHLQPEHHATGKALIRSEWFLDSFRKVRRCRDVSHYSPQLMEKIFQRHHFAAVVVMVFAYVFLIIIGFFMDLPAFQIPAAASSILFFAILIGLSGAFTYFFQSWSIPALLVFLVIMNLFYSWQWIDPHNKAYGLSYSEEKRPVYSQDVLEKMSSRTEIQADKQHMYGILDRWKAKQGEERPLMIVITTSGGGIRSATFTMNTLRKLDSITGGDLMKKTFLISGASGGMIGATYYRELYRQKLSDPAIEPTAQKYVDDISGDLLNPTFSSFVARDLFAPEQRFSIGENGYLKDRGYSFEQALNRNTRGFLDKKLGDYKQEEYEARIPLIFYHNVITRDGKKLLISTQPIRFMMKPVSDSTETVHADAVDFTSFFQSQHPLDLRLLTALRMNATFPIVLPNVLLPSEPAIDVMDGGLRDNFGVETTLRFLSAMEEWIEKNTRGVLMIQIRDRMDGGWENPYASGSLTHNMVKPFFILQNNWYKVMEYNQSDMFSYFYTGNTFQVRKLSFQYIPDKEENKAALNFHLTQREKKDIAASLYSKSNSKNLHTLAEILKEEFKEPANGNSRE